MHISKKIQSWKMIWPPYAIKVLADLEKMEHEHDHCQRFGGETIKNIMTRHENALKEIDKLKGKHK